MYHIFPISLSCNIHQNRFESWILAHIQNKNQNNCRDDLRYISCCLWQQPIGVYTLALCGCHRWSQMSPLVSRPLDSCPKPSPLLQHSPSLPLPRITSLKWQILVLLPTGITWYGPSSDIDIKDWIIEITELVHNMFFHFPVYKS